MIQVSASILKARADIRAGFFVIDAAGGRAQKTYSLDVARHSPAETQAAGRNVSIAAQFFTRPTVEQAIHQLPEGGLKAFSRNFVRFGLVRILQATKIRLFYYP